MRAATDGVAKPLDQRVLLAQDLLVGFGPAARRERKTSAGAVGQVDGAPFQPQHVPGRFQEATAERLLVDKAVDGHAHLPHGLIECVFFAVEAAIDGRLEPPLRGPREDQDRDRFDANNHRADRGLLVQQALADQQGADDQPARVEQPDGHAHRHVDYPSVQQPLRLHQLVSRNTECVGDGVKQGDDEHGPRRPGHTQAGGVDHGVPEQPTDGQEGEQRRQQDPPHLIAFGRRTRAPIAVDQAGEADEEKDHGEADVTQRQHSQQVQGNLDIGAFRVRSRPGHAAPDARDRERGDSVEQAEDRATMFQQDGVRARKHEIEMQAEHRHHDCEGGKQEDQGRKHRNLGPMIAPHEGPDRDHAEEEEQGR